MARELGAEGWRKVADALVVVLSPLPLFND